MISCFREVAGDGEEMIEAVESAREHSYSVYGQLLIRV
ncbi:hypothetical protein A2U01_0059811, partial [Trifolium medium]|nr:hypothetical protein [Trifolium medium]